MKAFEKLSAGPSNSGCFQPQNRACSSRKHWPPQTNPPRNNSAEYPITPPRSSLSAAPVGHLDSADEPLIPHIKKHCQQKHLGKLSAGTGNCRHRPPASSTTRPGGFPIMTFRRPSTGGRPNCPRKPQSKGSLGPKGSTFDEPDICLVNPLRRWA